MSAPARARSSTHLPPRQNPIAANRAVSTAHHGAVIVYLRHQQHAAFHVGPAFALPIKVGNKHGVAERCQFLCLGEIPFLGAQDVGKEQDTGLRAAFSVADPVVGDLVAPTGVNVAIDAVGRPETWQQAFYARDLAGTVVLVGVPTPDMRLEMPLLDFFSHGGSLKSSWYGDCLPERDFPTLIDLYLQGRLPLDRFVSERIGLDDVEEAFHKMHGGKVLRSVVIL